jgi:DNA-binding XRE family transcriptional regulator
MKKKHIGTSVFKDVNRWKREDASLGKSVAEHIEKAKLGMMLKEVRAKERMTQGQLAEKAHVTQSVIARIESGSSKTLPRLDLFNRILHAAGYKTHIVVKKKDFILDIPLVA